MILKESKEVANFICTIFESIEKGLKDGSLSVGDFIHLMPIVKDAVPALNDIALVPEELKNASKEDLEDLNAYIKENFNLAHDGLEEFGEYLVDLVFMIADGIKRFKNLRVKPLEEKETDDKNGGDIDKAEEN